VIRPVERDCICPTRPPVAHTPACEEAFRAKFFGAWHRERDRFYGLGVMGRVESQPSLAAPPPAPA
ncbi:MAG TPA: hypothetical protein VFR49_02405, partial [Solirubrobacteraceae bacterium]|nr:hypothetical protein [Solirubrobacteraceae bacterium]